MTLVEIPENREIEMLQEFCATSAFTFEGIDIKSKEGRKALDVLEKLICKTGYEKKKCVGYWCKGSVINRLFGLTDSNAYSDDLVFLFIPEYHNPIVKQELGARWFDDIISSNTIKQNGIIFGHEPDFK